MGAHVLRASQFVARPPGEVFAFFSDPRNLGRITPDGLGFELRSSDLAMRPDLEIDYRIRPRARVPVHWRTRIDAWSPPHAFSDVQDRGPYRSWEHVHDFRPADGGTWVEDTVTYELPLGPLGDLAHGPLVRPQLERIFRHRARALEAILAVPANGANGTTRHRAAGSGTRSPGPQGSESDPSGPPRMTVAVAGGTGFVGGAIAAELFRRGHRVVVLTHRGEQARGVLPDEVELRMADVTRDDGIGDALAGIDVLVVALAFRNSPVEAPRRGRTFTAVDAAGTERLVDAAGRAGIGRLVYVSGAGAAPDARRHWFRAKWRAEEAVRRSGLPWTIVRPTWVYGPRDVSLNRFLAFARWLPFVPLPSSGRQVLAPVFVDDVARLAADALVEPAAENQVLEVGGPEAMPLREVVQRALRVAGIRRPVLPAPAPLVKLAVAPFVVLPEPPMTPAAIDFVNQPATVDLGPLMERLPRRLTPLEDGLGTYLAPDAGPGRLSFA
jgi:uncharacterized protein YbjT (DUF2867 family)/ligand-binding SRPBCC domain-containing protein